MVLFQMKALPFIYMVSIVPDEGIPPHIRGVYGIVPDEGIPPHIRGVYGIVPD